MVVRGGGLGDLIITLPHLWAIQSRLGPFTVVAPARALRLLRRMGIGAQHLPIESSAATRLLFGDGSDKRDWVVSWLKLNPAPATRRYLRLPHAPAPEEHMSEACWKELRAIGVEPLPLPDLRRVLSTSGTDVSRLLLHPGSGTAWKCWPAASYGELAHRLAGTGVWKDIAFLFGPEDDALAREFKALRLGSRFQFLFSEDIERTAEILCHTGLYVGNDSGVTHLSALLGVPTLALHGPTRPSEWGAIGPRSTHLYSPSPCSPCTPEVGRACRHRACMRALTMDMVEVAARKLHDADTGH